MSVIRIAVRIAARQALLGRTHVGDNVLDSRLGALDVTSDGMMRTDQDKPFIAIYTDAARAGRGDGAPESSVLDIRSFTANGATEITFETGITSAMTETDPDSDASVIVGLGTPSTDEGFEFQLDIIARQIGDALTDPDNVWADIYRGLIQRYVRIERARVGTAEGQKMAAHQIKVTAELIDDPVSGVLLDPGSPLAVFLDAASALDDEETVEHVAVLRSLFGGSDPDWKITQRRLGLTAAELRAMGLGPVESDVDQMMPILQQASLQVHGLQGREREVSA